MNTNAVDVASLRALLGPFKEDVAEPSPEWFAMKQNIFRGSLVPFTGTSCQMMIEFVLKDTGVSSEEFDAESPKPLSSLYAELEREVNLGWNPAISPTREIVRFASNSRCIIYSPFEDLALCEVGRRIIKSGKIIHHPEPKPFGCSETAMRRREYHPKARVAEHSLITMQRGFLEEAGFGIHDTDLIRLTGSTPEPNDHTSTAFTCHARYPNDGPLRLRIRSIVFSHVFGLDITSLGMKTLADWAEASPMVTERDGHMIVEDQGVELVYKPLPLPDSWRRLLLAMIALRKT